MKRAASGTILDTPVEQYCLQGELGLYPMLNDSIEENPWGPTESIPANKAALQGFRAQGVCVCVCVNLSAWRQGTVTKAYSNMHLQYNT